MNKFFQICFSRLGGNDNAAGWQAFNRTPGMSPLLERQYIAAENGNQPKDLQMPLDTNGNPLRMLEIVSGDNNIGLSMVQYGLTDSFGRDNMFCHGFLFQNAYELLKDPNNLLTIADDNFHFTPEETEIIPETLRCLPPFTEESALEACGMTADAYTELVYGVYSALSTQARTTIYIKTDGSNQMARALLYLIYSAVPYSLRPRITASTYTNPDIQNAMLIFCPKIPDGCKYIDPVTGDSNFVTPNLRKRWERALFVDHYARNYKTLAPRKADYYGSIEQWLSKMGDPGLQDMAAITLAFSMAEKRQSSDPAWMLYDWLALPLPNNNFLEHCIADFLGQVMQQNLELNANCEDMLLRRLEQASTKELIQMGKRYQAGKLLKLNTEQACAYLDKLEPSLFASIRSILLESKEGCDILRAFYLGKARALVNSTPLCLDDLAVFGKTFADLADTDSIWQVLADRAAKLAEAKLIAGASFSSTATELGNFYKENFKHADWSHYLNSLINVYDHQFREHFTPGRMDDYIEFYLKLYATDPPLAESKLLCTLYQKIRKGDYAYVAKTITACCAPDKAQTAFSRHLSKTVRLLLDYALQCGAAENCTCMEFWQAVANVLRKNIVTLLTDYQVRVFCDPEALRLSVEEDPYWTTVTLRHLSDQYRIFVTQTGDNSFKKNMDPVSRQLKLLEDEAKRQQKVQKTQKRQQKEQPPAPAKPEPRKQKSQEWDPLEQERIAQRKRTAAPGPETAPAPRRSAAAPEMTDPLPPRSKRNASAAAESTPDYPRHKATAVPDPEPARKKRRPEAQDLPQEQPEEQPREKGISALFSKFFGRGGKK